MKSNSILDALEKAFQSKENYFILLEDRSYNLSSEEIALFLEDEPLRSLNFSEGLIEEGRDIFLKGNPFSQIFFNEQPISININKIRLTIENVEFIFTQQFSKVMDKFKCFFCIKAPPSYSGKLTISNSNININPFNSNTGGISNQNYTLFQNDGASLTIQMENISIVVAGLEIFRNLLIVTPHWQGQFLERGVILSNIGFKGGDTSPVSKIFFTDTMVDMKNITIDNVKIYEIFGVRSLLKIEKCNFYLNYSNGLLEKQTSFILLEESELILSEFKLMGKSDKLIKANGSYIIFICFICKITMNNIVLQKISLYQVKIDINQNK